MSCRSGASDAEVGSILVELHVNEEDAGKVIGRQGRVIKAIRTLARAAASCTNTHVEVELIDWMRAWTDVAVLARTKNLQEGSSRRAQRAFPFAVRGLRGCLRAARAGRARAVRR